ncbi:hypothetical protein ACRQ1B_28850 [Rhizobium panacihumi]|uniref:hypothetical protein n=1 Tax=Rhizobium panacihumi TaxID=2008450 RepID=UPI003D79C53E
MRPYAKGVYLSLSAAIRTAYDRVGGVSKFAGHTRPKLATLSKYASDSDQNAETIMPIDVAIDLDRKAGQPIVTARMASILGYDVVPKIVAPMLAGGLTEADALDVMAEAMDFVRAIRGALADGKVCAMDRENLRREWLDLRHEMDEALLHAGVSETC